MKNLKITLMAFMALFLTFGFTSCGDNEKDEPTSPTSGTSNVGAEVYISSDLINYFDGNLTLKVGNNTKTVTLKKSEGTKVALTTNYSLYHFTIPTIDVTLTNTATNATATLTYKRNSTAAPSTNINFLEAVSIKITATNATTPESSENIQISSDEGVMASAFENFAKIIAATSNSETRPLTYSANNNITANFDYFIANAKAVAERLENVDPNATDDDDE